MDCELSYIPERLKSRDRQPIQFFRVREILYRRCKKEDIDTHFLKLSPFSDISVNRSGSIDEQLSEPEDVLFNFSTRNNFEKYNDQTYISLEIKELNKNFQYDKFYSNSKNKVRIFLNHKIEPCNYSHCCFEIYFNDIEIISKEIYEKTIKKDTDIKDWCRLEIIKMMISNKCV